jgi:ribosomal protein S18 acetylase RimI-like enzyme
MTPTRLTNPSPSQLDALAKLLTDCIAAGASIGWVRTPTLDAARAYWQRIADSEARGERCWWVIADGDCIIGSAQLVIDGPENGRQRAEVCKVMVHPVARRRGFGQALMWTAETEARNLNRRLILLDTNTDSPAQRMYESLGWQVCGVMPDYAEQSDGSLGATTWMFKRLSP